MPWVKRQRRFLRLWHWLRGDLEILPGLPQVRQNCGLIFAYIILPRYCVLLPIYKISLRGFKRPYLEEFFGKARDLRAEVPAAQRGLIPSIYEVMVPVPDTPGAISAVTSLLASAALSLKDISIVRQREGEVGALRLGLADGASRDLALEILLSEGYRAYGR